METGTIVEFKAGKRNTVANLEFKAFAKAFPISNMLVATVFKKTYCLCHHLPGVFKGARICKEMRRVSLTSLCWGFALQTLQCLALSCPLPSIKWLISSLQPPIQQVCGGSSNVGWCAHSLLHVTVPLGSLRDLYKLVKWFLGTLRCIFFHQKCHVLAVSLPGRILSPVSFPSPPQGQPRNGRGIGHGFSSCCFRLATSSSTLASNPKNTRTRGQIA